MKPVRTIALVDVEAAGGIDPARLARSLHLDVRRLERGRYDVSGGSKRHYVDLITPQGERCDCGDHLWRQSICKHILACMIREGDERVVLAVATLVARLTGEAEHLRSALRGDTIVLSPSLKQRVSHASGLPLGDLRFERDRSGESSDVEVTDRRTGEFVGVVTPSGDGPQFIRHDLRASATSELAA